MASVGRSAERAALNALLDDAAGSAAARDMQVARLTGFESETQLGYAALHRLLLPYPGHLQRLPGLQHDALRSTFGLVGGRRPTGSWRGWGHRAGHTGHAAVGAVGSACPLSSAACR